jgi:hypothetical protein
MAWNVPDDWGCYYRKCGDCGATYHLSEGGCGCYDEGGENDPWADYEECECGLGDWDCDDPDEARCKKCGTGPFRTTVSRVEKIKKARKDHDDYIKAGDSYQRTVERGFYPGGGTRIIVSKVLLRKAVPQEAT